MEILLLLVAKIYLKTVVITFLETSKLVGLIMSGWNVTFWPSVNMQHCPARLQWDNLLGGCLVKTPKSQNTECQNTENQNTEWPKHRMTKTPKIVRLSIYL